ncbi:hypothetical protein CASFOL_000410 [Castilleja foliolosa]|uniref:Uncharacterized protein n=1 Tax=Castilleja foliolosa TaxID=1961234 RepID=A0ABD3ESK5_9LAMI
MAIIKRIIKGYFGFVNSIPALVLDLMVDNEAREFIDEYKFNPIFLQWPDLDFFNSRIHIEAQQMNNNWSVEKLLQLIINHCPSWRVGIVSQMMLLCWVISRTTGDVLGEERNEDSF